MRKQFNPESFEVWLDYYSNQTSQIGYGIHGFRGAPYQRGAGLGNFFRALFRMAVPVIKSAAGHIGKEALTTGANIASDVIKGRPIVESIEEHGREGASKLFGRASRAMQSGQGLGFRPKSIKDKPIDIFDKKVKKHK